MASYTQGVASNAIALRVDGAPFDDIRVRHAMQHAINGEEIVATYLKGFGDPTPYSLCGEYLKGWYIPFDEWPEEYKANYTYDPEKAKQLLAEAGYPNGFKVTRLLASTASASTP